MLCDITKLNKNIRVIGDIKERMLYKKTPIHNNSKLNIADIIFTADSLRIYSRPVRTGEKLDIIIDLNIKVLVKT